MVKLPKELQKKYKNKRNEKVKLGSENLLHYKKDPRQCNESDLRLLEAMLINVKHTNEKELEVNLNLQIGEIYKFLGPLDKSIEAFENALRIKQKSI